VIREGIQKLVEGYDLTPAESTAIMTEIMTGKTSNAQIAAFLTALRMKGETVDELAAFAQVMRSHCKRIHPKVQGRLIDTCGTGGDKLKTFNVSTAAAFVTAGAGVPVAKHGNRAVTSSSGSADVLEKLGINLALDASVVEDLIGQVGIGFMFAPAFHPAMKYVAETRREIGIRTVFNVLGPLTNPAGATAQVIGVYDAKLVEPLAYTLQKMGSEEAMVVHGQDGLDEVSTVGKTLVAHLKAGKVTNSEKSPEDFGIQKAAVTDLQCNSAEESAQTIFNVLNNKEEGAKADIVLVNAAAGILVGGKASSFGEGMALAQKSITSGAAYFKLRRLVKLSGGNMQKLKEFERT
jgi:anthranilate phosphoribosyltransferase